MKNLPTFKQFSEHHDFIEPIEESLKQDFLSLDRVDPDHSVNESSLLNQVKNQISKFFLGSFSRLNMIDEAREIILDLRIDLIEREAEFENKIEELQKEISKLPKTEDNAAKVEEIRKKRELLIREIESFRKSQELKIRKSRDVARRLAAGNKRRQEYLEAGLAEDEIAIAELEYKMAKQRVTDTTKLGELEDAIKLAKVDAEEKAKLVKDNTSDAAEKGKTQSTDFALDPENEKKKILRKKPLDIISYKNKLEKEIADLKAELETKITSLGKKLKKGAGAISQKALQNIRLDLIELTEQLDCKINILRRVKSLGKTEDQIKKSMDTESELTALSKKINQDIKDGQDEKTGTKKIVSDLFVTSGGNIAVTPEGVENAKKKLND